MPRVVSFLGSTHHHFLNGYRFGFAFFRMDVKMTLMTFLINGKNLMLYCSIFCSVADTDSLNISQSVLALNTSTFSFPYMLLSYFQLIVQTGCVHHEQA